MAERYKREDNPCAEWQFSNVDIDHRDGGRRPVKRAAKKKIDAMDASLNAVGMMSRDSVCCRQGKTRLAGRVSFRCLPSLRSLFRTQRKPTD